MTQLTAVSLFAGIGGLDLAFTQAGVRVVAAVEIDAAARGVIHDQLPDTALLNDVRKVTADGLRAAGFDPNRGVLLAGWPCQDISVAGRRLGLGGARSGLFWEIIRILTDLRPRWFCLENVPGLLSAVCPCLGGNERVCGGACAAPHPVRGGACGYAPTGGGRCMELHGGAMGAVVGALAELGYGVAYRVLDAQHFGVPQRRRRVVFVGCAGDWAAPVQVLLEPEVGGGDPAAGRTARPGTAVIAALRAGSGGGCGPDDNDATGDRLIPTLTASMGSNVGHPGDAGKDDIILAVAATLTAGSAAGRTPGRRREDDENIVVAALTARQGKGPDSDAIQTLVPVAFDTAQITSPENRVNPQPGDPAMPLAATGQPHVAFALRTDPGGTGQGHNTTYVPLGGDGIAHALTAEGADASEDGTGRRTPLVPISIAVNQDFSTGQDIAQPITGSNGQPGTIAVPIDLRNAVREGGPGRYTPGTGIGEPGDPAYTVSATERAIPGVATTTAVRRLTPTECERLQGFPDGWAATSWGKPQSDSARYRQLGNSVAVPVFRWIARRILHQQSGAAV